MYEQIRGANNKTERLWVRIRSARFIAKKQSQRWFFEIRYFSNERRMSGKKINAKDSGRAPRTHTLTARYGAYKYKTAEISAERSFFQTVFAKKNIESVEKSNDITKSSFNEKIAVIPNWINKAPKKKGVCE